MKVLAILLVPMFLMAQMVAGSKSDISTDNRLTVYSSRCERDCVCAKCHSEKILMPFPPRDVLQFPHSLYTPRHKHYICTGTQTTMSVGRDFL